MNDSVVKFSCDVTERRMDEDGSYSMVIVNRCAFTVRNHESCINSRNFVINQLSAEQVTEDNVDSIKELLTNHFHNFHNILNIVLDESKLFGGVRSITGYLDVEIEYDDTIGSMAIPVRLFKISSADDLPSITPSRFVTNHRFRFPTEIKTPVWVCDFQILFPDDDFLQDKMYHFLMYARDINHLFNYPDIVQWPSLGVLFNYDVSTTVWKIGGLTEFGESIDEAIDIKTGEKRAWVPASSENKTDEHIEEEVERHGFYIES